MKCVNTAELKNQANQILRGVEQRHPVVITRNGHPCAALIPLTEVELDDLVWEFSAPVQKAIREGLEDIEKGRIISLKDFARKHGLR